MMYNLQNLLSVVGVDDDAFVQTSTEETARSAYTRIDCLLRLAEGKRVLHVGCCDHIGLIDKKIESQTWLHGLLCEKASECWGIDIEYEAVQHVKALGYKNIFCCDAAKALPAEITRHEFDIVILGEMVEHLDCPIEFLKSLKKNLHGSYELVITVPNAFFLENFINVMGRFERINSDHRAWYTAYTISKILSRSGYAIRDVIYTFRSNPDGYKVSDDLIRALYDAHPEYRDVIVARASSTESTINNPLKADVGDSKPLRLAWDEYFKIKQRVISTVAAERDKALAERDAAWKAHDAVCVELDEIRSSLIWKIVSPIFKCFHKGCS